MNSTLVIVIFYLLAFFSVVSAGIVALSRNIVRSAFAMVVTFLGVAGLFILLSADFLAATQLLVYVGGILVLILFAVMLSSRIREIKISNLSVGYISGGLILLPLLALLVLVSVKAPWLQTHSIYKPTTSEIGRELLTRYILPFEAISLLLLVGLIGAVVIARRERD